MKKPTNLIRAMYALVWPLVVLDALALTFESGAVLNFDENLESDFVFHQQVDKDYAFNMVSDWKRNGDLSHRFELRHGDCRVIDKVVNDKKFDEQSIKEHCGTGRERVQVGRKSWAPGEDMWWGISLSLPADFEPDHNNICTMLLQIKQDDRDGLDMFENESMVREIKPGEVSQARYKYALGHGVFAVGICGAEVGLCVNRTWGPKFDTSYQCEKKHIGYLHRFVNTWVDFTFRYDTREFAEGKTLLEVWVSGEKIGSYKNVTEHFPDAYTPRYGLYRSQFKGKEKGSKETLVAYFDEVRYGSSYEEVAVQEQSEPVD